MDNVITLKTTENFFWSNCDALKIRFLHFDPRGIHLIEKIDLMGGMLNP